VAYQKEGEDDTTDEEPFTELERDDCAVILRAGGEDDV
jgi:hypothetical protein